MIAGEDGTSKGRNKIDQLKRNANLFRAGLERMGCEVLGHQVMITCMQTCWYSVPAWAHTRTYTHTHTHARTHTRARARTRTHTHTHTRTRP